MTDNTLTAAREALKTAFGWNYAPDVIAWRIAALIDNPADTWIGGTVHVGQVSGGTDETFSGIIAVIGASTITWIEFKNIPRQGEPWECTVRTRTRALSDARKIETGNEPRLDTYAVSDAQTDMPLFHDEWATITFADGDELKLPFPWPYKRQEGQPLGDALHRITRAMGSTT